MTSVAPVAPTRSFDPACRKRETVEVHLAEREFRWRQTRGYGDNVKVRPDPRRWHARRHPTVGAIAESPSQIVNVTVADSFSATHTVTDVAVTDRGLGPASTVGKLPIRLPSDGHAIGILSHAVRLKGEHYGCPISEQSQGRCSAVHPKLSS